MDWKLFVSTFVLIFLAELGDKTQLAAMAKVATGEHGKWTVFLGASAALVTSTLIAVLIGSALAKYISPQHIKFCAGTMFVLFGILIFIDLARDEEKKSESAKTEAKTGLLGKVVLEMASEFEKHSAADYRSLAQKISDGAVKTLLLELAIEEENHLADIGQLSEPHAAAEFDGKRPSVTPRMKPLSAEDREYENNILASSVEHELAMAGFYQGLAARTHLDSLKAVFTRLAEEEESHARRLRELEAKL